MCSKARTRLEMYYFNTFLPSLGQMKAHQKIKVKWLAVEVSLSSRKNVHLGFHQQKMHSQVKHFQSLSK